MSKDSHVHKFDEPIETIEPLRRYVIENGKMQKDVITGKDKLKQRKCKCGATETYDLERMKAS